MRVILTIVCLIVYSQLPAQDKNAASCIKCHEAVSGGAHTPDNKSCTNCHKSNGKQHPAKKIQAFELKEKGAALCVTCHDPVNTQDNLHKPVKKGNCVSCHDPHKSENEKMLKDPVPANCYNCHEEIGTQADSATHFHSFLKKGASCISCHNPHESNFTKLLNAPPKDLCLQCHDMAIRKKGREIRSIKDELTENKFVHTVINQEGCAGCHDPHGTKESVFLKARYQQGTYVPAKNKDNVALCFQCHNAALLEKKTVAAETGFRNGEQNLHNKHVNKFKGRNCTNCHGIHAGPNEFMIQNTVRFGNWDMPLRYTKTATGGTCVTACHAEKTYSRTVNPKP